MSLPVEGIFVDFAGEHPVSRMKSGEVKPRKARREKLAQVMGLKPKQL